jgi:hypothetical protein
VAAQGVLDDEDAVTDQSERDGAPHGLGGAVAGLADAEDVLDVEEGDLD